MAEGVYADAAIEIVPPGSLLSEPVTVKDIHLPTATAHTLSFSAPFALTSTRAQRTKARAFVLYFDTFFPATPDPVDPDEEVHVAREGEARTAEVWAPRRRPSQPELPPLSPTSPKMPHLPRKPSLKRPLSERMVEGEQAQPQPQPPALPRARSAGPQRMASFSTGPASVPTHWKQTVFLLREPIDVREGAPPSLS
jgi:protein arginine N-methyltransferase 3